MPSFNPDDKISKHFTYKEALYLPLWNRMAIERDGLNAQVLSSIQYFLVNYMDKVREFYTLPIIVHCCYRPKLYNETIGGSELSAHLCRLKNVAAMDFHVDKMSCEAARQLIVPELSAMGLRLEDNGTGANWLHLDNKKPNPNRFFKP